MIAVNQKNQIQLKITHVYVRYYILNICKVQMATNLFDSLRENCCIWNKSVANREQNPCSRS